MMMIVEGEKADIVVVVWSVMSMDARKFDHKAHGRRPWLTGVWLVSSSIRRKFVVLEW